MASPTNPDTDRVASRNAPAVTEPRGLRRDAAENRRRLLEAARTVFAEHGLEVSVEEIAHVAGVGIGTLYRRFPTKDALIAELVHELLEDVLTLAREAELVPGGHALEQFLYSVGEVQSANRGCLARIWSDDASTELYERYRGHLATLMADAQAHGTVRADATLTDLDLALWSVRGIIETSGSASRVAWRRQLAIIMAGLRPGDDPLTEAAMPEELVSHVRASATRAV